MDKKTDKIIVTGACVERISYGKITNNAVPTRSGGRKISTEKSIDSVKYRLSTIKNQISNVRRMILGNFGIGSYVYTLTFAELTTDIDEASKEFKNFIDRLRVNFKGITINYLAVYEFTELGSVHYHMITNANIQEEQLRKIWVCGKEVEIDEMDSLERLQKVASYFVKGFSDPRIGSRTPYKASRTLSKPVKLLSAEAKNAEDVYQLEDRVVQSMYNYESKFNGQISVDVFLIQD
ncbi:MAG: hypothetical protein WD469_08425 [Paenibacillaceae bacterium]